MSDKGDDQDEVLLERWGIPASWAWERLGKICVVASGGTPDTKDDANFTNGTIPWITPADLSGYREKSVSRGERNITQKGLDESSATLLPKGTVLFSSRAPIGYVVIASNPVATNQGFKNFLPPPELTSDYLYFYLQRAKSIAVELASGTTFLEISAKRVAQIPLPLSPLPEQHRIVEKIDELFSDLDAGVSALQRAKANLKRYRASVLKSAVEGRLTEEWRKQHPQSEDGGMLLDRILWERKEKWEKDQLLKFKEKSKEPPKNWQSKYEEPSAPDTSELPELPEGWVWATVEQVVAQEPYSLAIGPFGSNLTVADYRDEGVPLVFVRNIRTEVFGGEGSKYVTRAKAQELVAHAVDGGDILVTKMGDPPGDCCIYPPGLPRSIITADCIKVRLHGLLSFARLFVYAVRSEAVKSQIAKITKGVAQQKVSLGRFANVSMPLPPLAEQKQIVALVEERLSQIDSAQKTIDAELIRSKRLRQSILKRAFEGKLVPQDPKDEPASVLLEHIKASKDTEQPKKKTKKVKAKSK